jgi:hypothetical protein
VVFLKVILFLEMKKGKEESSKKAQPGTKKHKSFITDERIKFV